MSLNYLHNIITEILKKNGSYCNICEISRKIVSVSYDDLRYFIRANDSIYRYNHPFVGLRNNDNHRYI